MIQCQLIKKCTDINQILINKYVNKSFIYFMIPYMSQIRSSLVITTVSKFM